MARTRGGRLRHVGSSVSLRQQAQVECPLEEAGAVSMHVGRRVGMRGGVSSARPGGIGIDWTQILTQLEDLLRDVTRSCQGAPHAPHRVARHRDDWRLPTVGRLRPQHRRLTHRPQRWTHHRTPLMCPGVDGYGDIDVVMDFNAGVAASCITRPGKCTTPPLNTIGNVSRDLSATHVAIVAIATPTADRSVG
jgi:hypothetical protein